MQVNKIASCHLLQMKQDINKKGRKHNNTWRGAAE